MLDKLDAPRVWLIDADISTAVSDELIEIPTFGLKNSLNVASACPVVVFEVLRQWGQL